MTVAAPMEGVKMKRRWLAAFFAALALSAAQPSFAEPAPKVFRVGWIASSEPTTPELRALYHAFFDALRENGFVDGQNVVVERKYLGRHQEQFAAAAAEFIVKKVDVLVTSGSPATRTAKETTRSVPIVFLGAVAPDLGGLVTNFARPEGNVTGIASSLGTGKAAGPVGRLFQLFRQIAPERSRVAIFWGSPEKGGWNTIEHEIGAATQLGMTPIPLEVKSNAELEKALQVVLRERADAIYPQLLMSPYSEQISAFAATHRLPIIEFGPTWMQRGAVLSVVPDYGYMMRRAGYYVARILKGAQPRELPIEQTKLDFVVNVKTARTLGLKVPPVVLLSADRVIE
jgi:putative ABC transport system substrate-binding protein